MPRFEFASGNSNKYWEISRKGSTLTIHFGRAGSTGQTKVKIFSTSEEAKQAHEKLIAQKLKKGYLEAVSGTKPAKGQISASPAMTQDQFWQLIDRSRRASKNTLEQVDILKAMLIQFTPDQILAFDKHLRTAAAEAYRWNLWAAAHIMNGGCGDDGFQYFIGWLIAQGRKHFEAALADPNDAGKRQEAGGYFQCEGILYVGAEAYEKVSGKKNFYEKRHSVPRKLKGREWDEDRVHKVVPRLAKQFDWY